MQIREDDRLIDTPEVREHLLDRVRAEAELQQLDAIEHRATGNVGFFCSGRWGTERVVLKLNASPIEIEWMTAVSGRTEGIVPKVYAAGATLGGADLGWLVLADTPHHFHSARAEDARKFVAACAGFQRIAENIDGTTYGIDHEFFDRFLHEAIAAGCPGPGAAVLDRLDSDLAWLDAQSPRIRCHGDAHFGNAVSAEPGGRLLLIDPIPRTAHWAWDAAYAQMTSCVPGTPDLVPMLAEERQAVGLPVATGTTLQRIETTLLAWSSMLWWAIIPFRRSDAWWAGQVERNVRRLARSG